MKVYVQQLSQEGTVARVVAQRKTKTQHTDAEVAGGVTSEGATVCIDVILDPDSAHRKLFLSDDKKQVRLLDNPEKFSYCTIIWWISEFHSFIFYRISH